MKIVYGPVSSWRLGKSLGVDVICTKDKICSFDCKYCQLVHTRRITKEQGTFISPDALDQELAIALEQTTPDVITLSGMGEPTLARNLDEIISVIDKRTNLPKAVLTNSTLLYTASVQNSLQQLDIIIAKLDAPNPRLFQQINQPAGGVTFEDTLKGIRQMRKTFSGRFDLQMMFIEDNKDMGKEMAELARSIDPDYVEINTPLRPCKVQPLPQSILDGITTYFTDIKVMSVYHADKPMTDPLDKQELIRRRRMES